MRTTKIVLAAALTLVSGAAFAASGNVSDAMKRGVSSVAMERQVDQRPRAITGLPASEPTIFGHAPLTQTYGLPRQNNG